MAFILLVRDGDTTRLFTPAVFESRQAALAELPRAGAITGTEELFLVDLDAATPVIVVAQEAAAPAVPPVAEDLPAEESVGVWEVPAPVEEAPVEEPAEELAEAPVEEPVEEPAEELAPPPEDSDDLPLALRRAAGALESSGIAAPESVTLAPEEPASPAEPEAAPPEPPPAETEPAPEPEPEPAPQVGDVAPAAWPWDVTGEESAESAEPEPAEAEPEPAEAEPDPHENRDDLTAITDSLDSDGSESVEPPAPYVPDPLEEPARDVEPLVHVNGDDEAVTPPRPVIMGSYDTEDGSITIEVPEIAEVSEVHPQLEVAEPAGVAPVDAPPVAPVEAAPDPPVSEAQPSAEPASLEPGLLEDLDDTAPADDEEPTAYEAGASDIAELTCEECVYLATCPKKGESDPSSCGSFQWKSV